jgi:hypothetical protein
MKDAWRPPVVYDISRYDAADVGTRQWQKCGSWGARPTCSTVKSCLPASLYILPCVIHQTGGGAQPLLDVSQPLSSKEAPCFKATSCPGTFAVVCSSERVREQPSCTRLSPPHNSQARVAGLPFSPPGAHGAGTVTGASQVAVGTKGASTSRSSRSPDGDRTDHLTGVATRGVSASKMKVILPFASALQP